MGIAWIAVDLRSLPERYVLFVGPAMAHVPPRRQRRHDGRLPKLRRPTPPKRTR